MKIRAKRLSYVIYIFIAVMLFVAAGCSAHSSIQPSAEEKTAASPTIVQKDGNIILLSADRSVTLCPVSEMVKNDSNGPKLLGMISHEHNYMYFLKGYDSKTGTGTMMGVNTDAKSPPVTVSDGVYSAQDSYNGDALFIKNFKDGAGDLYLYTRNGSPELKVQNAIPQLYGFSPDGRSFYYVIKNVGDYILYEYFHDKAEKVYEAPAKNFRYPFIDMKDDGSMLYGASDNMESLTLYKYSDGKSSEVITGVQPVLFSNSLDDLLFTTAGVSTGSMPLYYKELGKDAVCISQDVCFYRFPDYVNGFAQGNRFLLCEEDPDNPKPTETVFNLSDSFNGGPSETNITIDQSADKEDLYEYTIGKEKTFISKADLDSERGPDINKSFTAVSYELDGAPYIELDKNGTWVSQQLSGQEIQSEFDGSGNNFYWIDREYNLYRMSISDGKTEMLKEGIMSFSIIGDEVYATDNMNMFRISDGAKLCDFVDTVTEAEGGIYIRKTNGDILYFANGSDKGITVIKNSEEAPLRGARIRLSYLSPQDELTLKNLSEDADYYMDKYNLMTGGTTIASPHGTLQEDAALADSLLPGSVPENEMMEAEYFSDGFKELAVWSINQNDTNSLKSAGDKLSTAASFYESQNQAISD